MSNVNRIAADAGPAPSVEAAPTIRFGLLAQRLGDLAVFETTACDIADFEGGPLIPEER
jgi:hypothetical protein